MNMKAAGAWLIVITFWLVATSIFLTVAVVVPIYCFGLPYLWVLLGVAIMTAAFTWAHNYLRERRS